MAKKKTKNTIEETIEMPDLGSIISDSLNKQFKSLGYDVSYRLPSDYIENGTVPYYIPTGNYALDLAVSNKRYGGLPAGRIIEITGLEQSGKTLLSAHILAETQKMGGFAMYIDTEHSFVPEYFGQVCGIDFTKNWNHIEIEDLQTIFEIIESAIMKIRAIDADIPMTIVLDSIMGSSTSDELSAGYGKDGYATSKSIILSKAMRKLTNVFGRQNITFIATNQLRYNVNANMPGQDKYITSGGKAIDFHSSVKIRIKRIKTITITDQYGNKEKVGKTIEASIIKNRLGPPEKVVKFDIMYQSGIDEIQSIIDLGLRYKVLSQSGAYYDYKSSSDEQIRFQKSKFNEVFNGSNGLLDELKDNIADRYIMVYNDKKIVDTYNDPNVKVEDYDEESQEEVVSIED